MTAFADDCNREVKKSANSPRMWLAFVKVPMPSSWFATLGILASLDRTYRYDMLCANA
jgi:hypothetical protein